jgi:hypothetical protein
MPSRLRSFFSRKHGSENNNDTALLLSKKSSVKSSSTKSPKKTLRRRISSIRRSQNKRNTEKVKQNLNNAFRNKINKNTKKNSEFNANKMEYVKKHYTKLYQILTNSDNVLAKHNSVHGQNINVSTDIFDIANAMGIDYSKKSSKSEQINIIMEKILESRDFCEEIEEWIKDDLSIKARKIHNDIL